jgi:hypothetical protein
VRRTARTEPESSFAHEPPITVIAPEAVNRIHVQNLAISTALSRHYVVNFIPPDEVIDVLNAAGVRFLLAGAHAIGGWTNEPRTTHDVDVLVASRQVRTAVRALESAFPHLQVQDLPVVIRFVDPATKKVVIDVMKPNQALHKVALRYTHRIETPERTYHIPSLEFALAMKFAAMVSPNRQEDKKLFDAGDFIRMVKTNSQIDLDKLAKLGELVYPGGEKEILEMVRRVRSGEGLIL